MRFEQSFQIAAPVETVWAILADLETWPDWAPTFEKMEFPAGSTLAPGLEVKLWVRDVPPSVFRVTDCVAGQGFAWVTTVRGIHSVAEHRLEARDGGTKLTLAVEMNGLMATLFGPAIRRVAERNIALEGNGLKARAQSLAGGPEADRAP